MAINFTKAASIYDHYIRLALTSAGVTITADMDSELASANEALSSLDGTISRIHDAVPSSAQKRSGS
jgi:hypothetical protein